MSATQRLKAIRIGRRYTFEPRLWLCILAVPMALLSALSISVFCYMRAFADVGQYYSGELSGLIVDSLSLRTLLPAALLWLVYVFALHALHWGRVSSAVVALVLSFNIVTALSMEHSGFQEIFLPCGIAGNAVVVLGFAALLYVCVELICLLCDYKTRYRIWTDAWDTADNGLFFFSAFSLILILWLPVLLCCYPGSVHDDTCNQIMGWLGLKPVAASQPVLTTLFYGAFFKLGMAVGGQVKGIFLGLLCQDVIVSAAMGLAAMYVYRYTRSKVWFWLTVAFFGLLPVWQSAAQVLLTDVLHTGCFLLFVCVYLECLRKREKSWKNVMLLFLTALLVASTRQSAFYLVAVCILAAALWHWRSFLLPYLAMLGVFLGLFWLSSNVLYPYLGISGEWESENYSMQFQQVALYCRTYGDEMTVDEKAIVNSTLDYDAIVQEDTPAGSDPVMSADYNVLADHSQFWQLYRQMLRRHPLFFLKAAVMGSFEHFNPWFADVDFHVYISREDDFLTVDYRNNLYQSLHALWLSCLACPALRLLIGTGLYAWVLVLLIVYSIRKKSGLSLLGLLPSVISVLGLLTCPVNGNIRCGYPLIAAAPLSFAWVLYAVASKSPESPNLSKLRTEQRESVHFKLFRPLTKEELKVTEFDPNEPPPELPPQEKSSRPGTGKAWKPGPLLSVMTRYVGVPKAPKTYLDFLKVLAIFLVLWNHTSTGFDLYNRVPEMPQHMLYLCFSIFDKIAVPLFFMASGALLLGREESWRKILRYRVRRFALILLVVSAINYCQYYNDNSSFSFYDFISRLYTGSVRTPLWYLYAYLAFLLMLPFLRKLARCMREQDYIWLVGFFIVTQLLSVIDFFWFHGKNYHISDFRFFTSQNYVVYSLFGFYIERVMKKERMNLETLTILIALSALSVGATYLLTEQRMTYFEAWTTNNSQDFFNTFIAIPSITVFYSAKYFYDRYPASARGAAVWSLLSTGTFGTYLFERFWRDNTEFIFHKISGKLGSFASSLIHILAACALGIAATLLYKVVTGFLLEKIRQFFGLRGDKNKPAMVYTVPTEDISDLEEIETLLVGNAQHKAAAQPREDGRK